jgi:transcriptional regulator with XRE-family HTH domain
MKPLHYSGLVANRVRALRTTRRISGDRFAQDITDRGYPLTRSMLANIENGRFRTVPVDFFIASMQYFDLKYEDFFFGPLCSACQDDPPQQFVCKTCRRTRDPDGELVKC